MSEMSVSDFWELIAGAKRECGQDMDAYAQWLQDRLIALGPQQAQDFDDIFHGYHDLAYQYGLWSAASIMCSGCTDDGFMDFRSWLIAQGKEVYLAALKDPDSLAEVEPYGDCQFEILAYAGSKALDTMTGQSAYEGASTVSGEALEVELKKEIVYGEGIGYPYEPNELIEHFPRLCAKHLTPEQRAFFAKSHETTWNYSNPSIRTARENGLPQQKKPQMNMELGGM